MAGLNTLAAKMALGFQFINVGADVLALTDYFGRIAQAFRDAGG